jgi:hypothetical protein
MAVQLVIESPDLKMVQRILKGVASDKAPQRAISDAINRGLLAGRTAATRGVRRRYNIGSADAKSTFDMKKASWTSLEGHLSFKGPMLPIDLFKPTVRLKRTVRRGPRRHFVSVAIIKGNRKMVTGAFQTPGGIMERKQADRYPIFKVMTIGMPSMTRQTGIANDTLYRMEEIYNSRLEQNINAFLTGARR